MRIGCQSITFGNEIHKTNVESVFKEVRSAGYEGIEIGFFRLDPERKDEYIELLKKYSLALAAIHIGGDFHDEESVKKQLSNIPAVISLAKYLGCGNIFLSGQRLKNGEDYITTAKNINKLGEVITGEGLRLNYHNHDWEIADDAKGLYTIRDYTDKDNLSFVLDAGWVTRAGADPVRVIKELGCRLGNIHFKEFTADGKFTEMGEGVVDFKSVYGAVKDKEMWVIAEQDQSVIGVSESIARNYAYIKDLITKS